MGDTQTMGTTADGSFYVTGGTLRPDAPSYVPRQADRDLYEGLSRGQYCYVLTARQMGKSSLMARAAARLREEGVVVLSLDLTALGQNLSPEQWYDGLRSLVAWQLDLEEELDEFWLAHQRLGPLQRWMAALRQVVLARVPGRVVIAIDEIDVVQSLPFSTDEFFAGIRECYNRRSEDPEFSRLTFCLLGVASPSDLIQDTRTTPFNIGRRIELTDFTKAEAAPLAGGLLTSPPAPPRSGEGSKTFQAPPPRFGEGVGGRGQTLLARVLHWTGGHPYLTQRLCQAVADGPGETPPGDVDRLCENLFLSAGAQEQDDNLLFVRDRMLRGEADPASLLDLYARVRRGKRVPNDEADPRVSLLRIAGITRVEGGALRVRNRIYAQVFDGQWVLTHMPDAELRRQRAAYRRGLLRAAAVSAVILAIVVGLALIALSEARRADWQRQVAEERLYAADMRVARQDWEAGNVRAALDLLEAHRPRQGQDDLRGFEWRYLWRLCRRGDDLFTLRGHSGWVRVRFSHDGKTLISVSSDRTEKHWDVTSRRLIASVRSLEAERVPWSFTRDRRIQAWTTQDGRVKLWDHASRQEPVTLNWPKAHINDVALSPDGKMLVVCCGDKTLRLWDVLKRREVARHRHTLEFTGLEFSPDGRSLALQSHGVPIILWDVVGMREIAPLKGPADRSTSVFFSPDGRTLATGTYSGAVYLWDVAARREAGVLRGHKGQVMTMAFSPDGKTLATGGEDPTVRLWDLTTRQERAILRGHTDAIYSIAFSPDGKTLASGSLDHTVKLWGVAGKPEAEALHGHTDGISWLAFSPDGKTLASGSWDSTVKLWDLTTQREVATLPGSMVGQRTVAFSPDGRLLAVGSGLFGKPDWPGEIRLWDLASRRAIASLGVYPHGVMALAFSPDGKTLAMGGNAGTVKLIDLASRRRANLPGHRRLIHSVAFSPDGKTLASASFDGTVKLWDVATRRKVATLKGHSDEVDCVAFSPNGKTLATASFDHKVKLWDVARRTEVGTLRGLIKCCSVAFSPDGKTLATGSIGGPVRLWNLATRQEVVALEGPGPYAPLAFSPDGQFLASGSGSDVRSVLLWRAASFAETDAPGPTPQRQSSR